MIALKPIVHASLHAFHHAPLHTVRGSVWCVCKSQESDSEGSSAEGDANSQELLARIAMLQTEKVRLTDFLEERSEYLSQFGEEAKAEFDKIGEDALKELDEAGARITANIESEMLAFEESTELNRIEIEESEKKIVEFEDQMQKDRNEGLFFKNLGQKDLVDKAKPKEEVEKIKDVNKENSGNQTMKNVYLFFIGLLTFGIVDSVASSSGADWKRVSVLGGIIVVLFSLFINEQNKDSKKD
ncbi:hypothetical protein LR48_Vigan661s001400 [Vigna angularis]|uniref:Uncharacterized protein n=2 Tax=Phaseolus angularis TaxID=3914 RepID=A0A0L9TFX5_PHAAN|nr:uncharacterized protein LOC108322520 [Vigna angularis]KAG2380771.1 uncharacterized protein HKW66_Vig0201430 [Vigna angularis]KOM29377.1 hypothetical protein LR48_Vigan661s001400 [Vigna angularis]BAT97328.1 hypothetical protein VIGAN_09073500 [Vigna angularis var. angularis]